MKFTVNTILASAVAVMLPLLSCSKPEGNQEDKPEENKEPVTETRTSEFTVMSFNVAVDNLQETKGWQSRKVAVNNMITTEKPDIIGFQEAQAHEITDMINANPEYGWYGLGRDSGSKPANTTSYSAEEAMVVFWKKDVFKVITMGTFWLSETPEKVSLGWDASYMRTATWLEMEIKATGQRFFMFNTHLDNKGKTARTESMKLIADKIEEIDYSNLPCFLTADFNTTSTDAIFAPINGKMASARDFAVSSEKTKNTYNGYTANGKSQIDHIFYKKVTPLTFRVLNGNYGNIYISDHYPIIAKFSYTSTVTVTE